MSTTAAPKKSILKRPGTTTRRTQLQEPAPAKLPVTKTPQEKHNLTLALHHAQRLQLQKHTQSHILTSITTLLTYPSGPSPTPQESHTFTQLIQPFQPSDYTALIEERRCEERCGYVLCANQPRAVTMGEGAEWKLRGKGAGDYCSMECVRRSLYVKAQLSGVPAWERDAGHHVHVVLMGGENDEKIAPKSNGRVAKGEESKELAMECGEQPTSFRPRQVMMDSVVEKRASKPALPPSRLHGASYGRIEGYEPKVSFAQDKDDKRGDESDVEEEDDGYGDSNSEHDEEDDAILDAVQRDLGSSKKVESEQERREREEEEVAWRELDAGLKVLEAGGGS